MSGDLNRDKECDELVEGVVDPAFQQTCLTYNQAGSTSILRESFLLQIR